jgi:uncharacterized iron-regulated membrane protein
MLAARLAVPALAGLLAVASVGAAWQTWQLSGARQALAQERLSRADERARLQAAALQAQAENQATTQALQAAIEDAQHAAAQDRARLVRAAAADRAERDRLRDDIAAYAAGGGLATDDTLAACRARAAELGRAVEDGLRVQEDMAQAFGDLAVDYRTLYLSWPKMGEP